MKDQAICNIGHFDNGDDGQPCAASGRRLPQVDHVIFLDGKRIILLAQGRL